MSDSHISQSVEGGLLLIILYITILTNRKNGSRKAKNEEKAKIAENTVQ